MAENNADHTSNKNTLDEDEMWLKTIIYRQTETSKKQQRERYENYMLKISEQEQLVSFTTTCYFIRAIYIYITI